MPHVIERITAGDGRVLYARNEQPLGRIIDPRHVAMMNEMMQQTLLIGTAQKAALPRWPAAGKTGTSQDFRDAWFIGYTAHLVTGVWLGNDDGTPTKRVTGGGLPAEIWNRFMRSAHQGVPVAALPGTPSRGIVSRLFDGAPRPAFDRTPPIPPAPVQAEAGPTRGASLDGWLLDNLFSRH